MVTYFTRLEEGEDRGRISFIKLKINPSEGRRALKEKMTSFDIAALIPDLDLGIRGSRVNNIYQIPPCTLLLKLRQPRKPPLHLLIEAGKRIHLTSYIQKKPKKPPDFCMSLRKHLRNGRITGIEQNKFERVVTIKVTSREGEFRLTIELFGGGNIILVSPQNRILQALYYRRMRDRKVLRGEVYQHAPPSGRNPLSLARQEFDEMKHLERLETVRALTQFLSIGGLYAEEILIRAKVEKGFPCGALTEQQMDELFSKLRRVLSIIKAGKSKPCVIIQEGEWVDVTPIPLKIYENFRKRTYETFNKALDEYYARATLAERGERVAKEVEKRLEKEKRILRRQKKALKDTMDKMEHYGRIGDSIFSHLGELQLLLQTIMEEKDNGKPWKKIVTHIEKERKDGSVPAIYFHSLKPKSLILNVSIENLVLPLNLRQSIQANAAIYYEESKKAERKLKGIEEAMRATQIRIKEIRKTWVKEAEKLPKPLIKRRKKKWYEKFRWFHSSDGFLVIGGRDATTNEVLIKKHMEPHDVVLHAEIHGAPFVLIKTHEKNTPEQTLKESTQFAASYSRAWREGLRAGSVYWVSPQQVSKSPPSGQHLKRGAFMIHGSKNYLRNVPLRLAVGIEKKEDHPIIIGGPVEAISKHTNTYIEIVPGDESGGRLAKHIRRLLAEKSSEALRKQILKIRLDEIQRLIPSGKGKVKAS